MCHRHIVVNGIYVNVGTRIGKETARIITAYQLLYGNPEAGNSASGIGLPSIGGL